MFAKLFDRRSLTTLFRALLAATLLSQAIWWLPRVAPAGEPYGLWPAGFSPQGFSLLFALSVPLLALAANEILHRFDLSDMGYHFTVLYPLAMLSWAAHAPLGGEFWYTQVSMLGFLLLLLRGYSHSKPGWVAFHLGLWAGLCTLIWLPLVILIPFSFVFLLIVGLFSLRAALALIVGFGLVFYLSWGLALLLGAPQWAGALWERFGQLHSALDFSLLNHWLSGWLGIFMLLVTLIFLTRIGNFIVYRRLMLSTFLLISHLSALAYLSLSGKYTLLGIWLFMAVFWLVWMLQLHTNRWVRDGLYLLVLLLVSSFWWWGY